MKILLLTLGLAIALFANPVKFKEVEQLTYSEQQEMMRFLNQKIRDKDYTSVFELGLVYENGVINPSGKITKKPDEATKYFIMAYEHGDYRSIFKIIPMLIEKKQYKKIWEITQTAIDNSAKNRSLLISAVTIYATTVMDFSTNREDFVNALYNISFVSNKELAEVPTLKFIKANLTNMLGDAKIAEQLLNEACNAKNAPTELKQMCFNTNNFLVAKDDVKKSIDECVSCSLIEK